MARSFAFSACKLTENPLYVDCGDQSKSWSQEVTYRKSPRVLHGTNHASYVRKVVGDMDASYVTLERAERGVYIKATNKLKVNQRSTTVALKF